MIAWGGLGFILVVWAVLAVAGPLLPLQPDAIDLARIIVPPAYGAWLGYDDLGRPIWDRLMAGAHVSFLVAFWVVCVSALVGTLMGAGSAYAGGFWDRAAVRIIDMFLAFPGMLLAIGLAGMLGPGLDNAVVALASVGWVGYARLARAQVLSLKHREHVVAAQTLGAGHARIIVRHLIPLIMAPLIVEATFGVVAAVTAEAGLSFLGLGVQPPHASWGGMIRDGTRYMLAAPHVVIAPGAALALVVLSVHLLGDRLRDWLDVRRRG